MGFVPKGFLSLRFMRFLFQLLMFCSSSLLFSQTILSEYPTGQSPYEGGMTALFNDMQQYFKTHDLKPCATPEMFWVTLKIDPTGRPFLIKKKSLERAIEKNPCAFELASKALGSLKKWRAATHRDKAVTAYVDFPFFPEDFFDNYQMDYDGTKRFEIPQFEGGKDDFKAQVDKNLAGYLDWNTYQPKGRFVVHFEIDAKGKMSVIEIEPKVANSTLLFEDITFAFKKIKGTWKPGHINGKATSFKLRQPINFDTF